jgi:hypothetical protein
MFDQRTGIFGPIDSYLGIYSKWPCFSLSVFAVSLILLSEWGAHRVHPDFADPRLDDAMHTRFLNLEPFSADLPLWWIWYEGGEIRRSASERKGSFIPYLLLIVFHASILSCAVGFTLFVLTMTLAVRAFRYDERVLRRWVSPLLCVLPWICDIAEDMYMLKVVAQYPKFQEPDTSSFERTAAWCSFGKWLGWACILCWWAIMALKLVLAPPARRAID